MPVNIKKQEPQATAFATGAIDHYFKHPCFKTLKNKKGKLDDSIDMRFNSTNNVNNRVQNAWRSNIAIPMVREAFLTRRAVLSTAFSQPDLITLQADGVTPFENAINMQDVVHSVR